MNRARSVWLLALVPLLVAGPAAAHSVPKDQHDRTIVVRLTGDAQKSEVAVVVAYRLEVDELTVVLDDMAPFSDQVDFTRYRDRRSEFYGEFTRLYAPILADNLVGKLDGKALKFECVKREHHLRDEKGQALGHLRCDFVFRAVAPGRTNREQQFQLREGNYETQTGKIDLAIVSDPPLRIESKTEPSAALKQRAQTQFEPGDEEKLRRVAATFTWTASGTGTGDAAPPPPAPGRGDGSEPSLLRLFMDSDDSLIWVLLLLSAGFGAVHALTPGHGKTLAAAYLVGARGTTLHALVLGLVTTLTHTGVVLVIAAGLMFVSPESRQAIVSALGLGMGLLIAGLGCWLLLRRLAGQADHIHIGGGHHHHHHHGHHHHHHGHADHDHDEHGNVIPRPGREETVGWWGVVILGMSGGIVPCWDAVALLGIAIGMDQLPLALPMLLAFSAGLAGVLVVIGMLVVHARNFAVSHMGEGRLVRGLPIVSAAVIAALGLWLCYESIHTKFPGPSPAARAAVRQP